MTTHATKNTSNNFNGAVLILTGLADLKNILVIPYLPAPRSGGYGIYICKSFKNKGSQIPVGIYPALDTGRK